MGCQPYDRCIELFNRNDDAITDPYSDSAVKNPEFKHTPYNQLSLGERGRLHFRYDFRYHVACHAENHANPSLCHQCCVTERCNFDWLDDSGFPHVAGTLDTDAEWLD